MKQVLIFLAISTILLVTIGVMGQTRRTREEEYIQKTITIEETQQILTTIMVCDPDGDGVMIEAEGLPVGATLSTTTPLPPSAIPDVSNPANCPDPIQCQECISPTSAWFGADFSWTPTQDQAGQYKIYIHAMDDKGGEDWVVYIINVTNKNRPPVL